MLVKEMTTTLARLTKPGGDNSHCTMEREEWAHNPDDYERPTQK